VPGKEQKTQCTQNNDFAGPLPQPGRALSSRLVRTIVRDHLHPAHDPDDESDEYDCPEDAADIHRDLLQESILIEADPSQPVGALPYTAGTKPTLPRGNRVFNRKGLETHQPTWAWTAHPRRIMVSCLAAAHGSIGLDDLPFKLLARGLPLIRNHGAATTTRCSFFAVASPRADSTLSLIARLEAQGPRPSCSMPARSFAARAAPRVPPHAFENRCDAAGMQNISNMFSTN
jgi:hypothetical protein